MSCALARPRTLALLALAAAIATAAAILVVGGGSSGSSEDWAAPNADTSNTRRTGGPIDSTSVGRLGVAWTLPLSALYTATPIVLDGVGLRARTCSQTSSRSTCTAAACAGRRRSTRRAPARTGSP